MNPSVRRSRAALLVVDGWVVALALLLLWPLMTSRGYPLARDLVFSPRQPWRTEWLGVSDAPARAVPLDALVAMASAVLGGEVLSRLALLGALVLAGTAAHRVLPGAHPVARTLVATFAVWNPFVIERLALGQWALLWGYGATFAVVVAAARYRRGSGRWSCTPPVLAALAPAAITPTGAVIGGVAAVLMGRGRGVRPAGLVAAVILVQLPWLVPTLLGSAGLTSDPAGVDAFRARDERPGGVVWTLVGLGGVWDAGSAPGSRAGLLGHASSALVLLVIVGGWSRLGRLTSHTDRRRLTGLAIGGLALAAMSSLPGGGALTRALVASVPGAGLLRDSQKWLVPFVVLAVLAAGACGDRLVRSTAAKAPDLVLTVGPALVGLLLVLVPDAAQTVWSTVRPVSYPNDLLRAAALVRPEGRGDLVTLPWTPYRRYPWGSPVAVYDPASRVFDTKVVMSDRLRVGGTELRGESARSAEIGTIVSRAPSTALGAELARAGVRWVLVQLDSPGGLGPVEEAATRRPADVGLRVLLAGEQFALYEVVDPVRAVTAEGGWRAPLVLAIDVLAVCLCAAALGSVGGRFAARVVGRRWRLPAGTLPRIHRGR